VRYSVPAPASKQPDAKMIAAASRVARYIETLNRALLMRTFASGYVTIVENFPPYLFEGPGAVGVWAKEMRAHLAGVTRLRHSFGPAHDFSRSGDQAYFSLPTIWRGIHHGKPFTENGGWAFVLTKQKGVWRVRGYGWAVIATSAR
jgi:hypothetical protein